MLPTMCRSVLAAVVFGCLALGCADAAALTRVTDRQATAAWLRARFTQVQAFAAIEPAAYAEGERVVAQVESECPSSLVGVPVGDSLAALEGESESAAQIAAYAPFRPADEAFAAAVNGLEWQNQKLTALVRAQVRGERAFLDAALPDTCADIRAWVQTGCTHLSPATLAQRKEWDKLTANEPEPQRERVVDRLTRRITPPERKLLALIAQAERAQFYRGLSKTGAMLSRMHKATGGVSVGSPL
jgi:hypothetical protein